LLGVQEKVVKEFDQIYASLRRWSGDRWVQLQKLHKDEKKLRFASYETPEYKISTSTLAGRLGMTIEDKKTGESVSFIGCDEKWDEEYDNHNGTECGDGTISSTYVTAIKMLDWLWKTWDVTLFAFFNA
jgi:hypothetical protein